MVKILAQTEVGKYAEFKCVDRLLCRLTNADGSGTIEQVPCSRSEVFSSDKMSMLDKRHLMKFLTFCLNWKTQMNSNGIFYIFDYLFVCFFRFGSAIVC